MAWDNLQRRYEVRNARIVASIDKGGAMIEHADIVYEEGRTAVLYADDNPRHPPRLALANEFKVIDAPDGASSVRSKAQITIDGEGEAGRLEIRGSGWIGYDEHGFISGTFTVPPVMLLGPGAKLPKVEVEDHPGLTMDEWMEHVATLEPRTSAEYDRATRGTSLPNYLLDDDDEDEIDLEDEDD